MLAVASVAAAAWAFAGTASAQVAPAPALAATIAVTPSSVTPPATATATATFQVGELANVTPGPRIAILSLNIVGSDGSLELDTASITTTGALTGCTPASAPPVLSYSCQVVGPKSTTDSYSISATIRSTTPGSGSPVVAQVSANSSWRDGNGDIQLGVTDSANLTVLLPGVDPPAGTTISATCVDDVVTVDIAANTNNANFFINVGDDLDLGAPAIPPGSYTFPAGGAADVRTRVFQLPSVDLIFDQSVTCTATPPTSVAPTTAAPTTAGSATTIVGGVSPDLPATGSANGHLTVLALLLTATGVLALAAARREERTSS